QINVGANATVTATAQWAQYSHTITYVANGGSGTMSNTVVKNATSGNTNVTLASDGFTYAGYHFVGWKVGSTVYQPGAKVAVAGNASVTATAQWELNTLTANSVSTQYAVVNKQISFTASSVADPTGVSASSYTASDIKLGNNSSNALTVTASGSTITCKATATGTYTFKLTPSTVDGYTSVPTTVTLVVKPVLQFNNAPTAGIIVS
ncbi:MAG: hypothetical protein E7Z63_01160, partial [Thermoplasmata archaeon]|nr:hypothetical protein [Thermoplasmata archaeon]